MCIIIAGAKPKIIDHGTTEERTCPNCHNAVRFQLAEVKHYFTFFFIPILPVSTKYEEFCPICRHGGEMTRQEFDQRLIARGP